MRFVVTVDTEADDAWSSPDNVRVSNVRELDRFQDLCDRYDVVPTYLLAYECATKDEALRVLKPLADTRRCEIGHHLHVWTTPPFQTEAPSGVDRDWIHAYQFQLPDSLFTEKAETLRQAIEDNFGRSPTAHRAGRWGVDQRTVDWLAMSGFVVETSLRPALRIRDADADTSRAPHGRRIESTRYQSRVNPHIWPSAAQRTTQQALIEVPVTVDFPHGTAVRLLFRYLNLKWPGELLMFRAFRRLTEMRMLYPDPANSDSSVPAR